MPSPARQLDLHVRDLGRMAYAEALALQRQVNEAVIAGTHPATLLLVEHEPVITISHRKTAPAHLVASPEQLERLGIDVQATDRGGDITYHGPGQLVAYPILRLNPLGLNLSRYMRLLEQIVIDTLAGFGIVGQREPGATGVWVGGQGTGIREQGSGTPDLSESASEGSDSNIRSFRHSAPAFPTPDTRCPTPAKICAMGVRVRKNTTMHGLALNVQPDLSHFQTIVPCGLADRGVTSMHELLGHRTPSMPQVKDQLVAITRATIHGGAPAAERS